MKLSTRLAVPVLIAASLTTIAAASTAHAGPSAHAPAKTAASAAHSLTQGFDLRNLSSSVITLNRIVNPGNGDAAPRIGTILKPGETLHYEKVFWFGNGSATELQLMQTNPTTHTATLFTVKLNIDPFLNIPNVRTDGAGVGDLVFDGNGTGSRQLNFKDKPGSPAVVVAPQDKQRQADLLNRLCGEGLAACTFTPTTTTTGPDEVQQKLSERNIGTGNLTINFKQAFTFGTTTSVELTASGKTSLFGLVEATLTGKYGQGWSENRTEEITRTFQVPPGRKGIVEVRQATIREHGTFTVTMANTTWELTDVYFDFPDKTKAPDVHTGDVA
jgi:hypothetical protein